MRTLQYDGEEGAKCGGRLEIEVVVGVDDWCWEEDSTTASAETSGVRKKGASAFLCFK